MSYKINDIKNILSHIKDSFIEADFIANNLNLQKLAYNSGCDWSLDSKYSLNLVSKNLTLVFPEDNYFFLLPEDKVDVALQNKEKNINNLSIFLNFISKLDNFKDLLNFDNYFLLDSEKEKYNKAFDKYKEIFGKNIFDYEYENLYFHLQASKNDISLTIANIFDEEKISFRFVNSRNNNKISLIDFTINDITIAITSKKTYLGVKLPRNIDYSLTLNFYHNDKRSLGFNIKDNNIIMLSDFFYGFKSHYQKIELTFINNNGKESTTIKNPEIEIFSLINLVKPQDYKVFFNNNYELTDSQKEIIDLKYLVDDQQLNNLPLDDLFGNHRKNFNDTQKYSKRKTNDLLDTLKLVYTKSLGIKNNAEFKKNRF